MLFPFLLTACGTLPQPFLGRPGVEGARLATPPPPILIVPVPGDALLGDQAAALYARDLAAALVERDVPSLSRSVLPYEWHLEVTAALAGDQVETGYTIVGPDGKTYGKIAGAAVAPAAWSEADPAMLEANAQGAAPALVRQLRMINAVVQESNPNSLENRPARVAFTGVTGAPGDGDQSLALGMTRDLPQLGIMLTPARKDADFVLSGRVVASPGKAGEEAVELDWTLRDTAGGFIGKVSQLHDLRRSDMVPYWGDVAAAAAGQAADGIKQVIANATLKKPVPKHPGRPVAASATPPAAPLR